MLDNKFTYIELNSFQYEYLIWRCPVPPLSSHPVNLEESRSLKKISTKSFIKNMSMNLLRTRFSYFLFVFLFKYDEVIIKQPSSCSFGKKVGKFLKIKITVVYSSFMNLWKCWSFRATRQRLIWYICLYNLSLYSSQYYFFHLFLKLALL